MTENEDILLSGREQDVQALKQDGHTHSEIAEQLGLSTSTVDEYSRRIANKREQAVETLAFLNDDEPLFEPALIEEEATGTDWLYCRRCGRRERVGKTSSHCLNCGSTHSSYNTDEWKYIPEIGTSDGVDAWCETCISEYFEEAKAAAVETGRIPCTQYDHSTHKVAEGAINNCRPRYVPLTRSQLTEIKDAWRERRHFVCPDCGRPKAKIETAMIEVPDAILHPDPPMVEQEGLRCACGWKGFDPELSFVKR